MILRLSILLAICVVVLYSCAVPAAPRGGPADTTPPVLDTLRSTPNYLTEVYMRKIVLQFDEFVQVKNISKELIVSPPLRYGPKVETDGKRVLFELDEREVLSDSTTYVIQFGESIQDFREGNPYKNYKHIFSTGPILDSGAIEGKLTDYMTGEPVEDAIVALYESNQDTMPIATSPLYYTRSDAHGDYTLNYLRERDYAVFAIADLNRNVKYDAGIGESIGYLESTLAVSQDSTVNQDLSLITPALDLTVTEITGSDRYLKITTSRDIDSVQFEFIPLSDYALAISAASEYPTSSREYYLNTTIDKIVSIYPDGTRDTTSAPQGAREKLALSESARGQNITLNPNQALELSWSAPIDSVLLDLISIEDSTAQNIVEGFKIDTLDSRKIYLFTNEIRDDRQKISLSPGAVVDKWGGTNRDSLSLYYTRSQSSDFGQLNLSITQLDSTTQYLAFIKKEDIIIDQWVISDQTNDNIGFVSLLPGDYTLILIQDSNKNNRWDSGTFPGRKLPEKFNSYDLESVRADWDVESELKWID